MLKHIATEISKLCYENGVLQTVLVNLMKNVVNKTSDSSLHQGYLLEGYGYEIREGRAVVNEEQAGKIIEMCENYLSGMSLINAAASIGLTMSHCGVKRMMFNKRYLGDDFYPAILSEELVNRLDAERKRREKALGRSFLQIKRGLERDGILNGAGNAKWYETNIKQILTNEKYIGDALLQKTYTVNTLEKKRVANTGYAPQYYVEGSHEGIIDKDVFLRVQAEISRRANILQDGKKRIYSSRYALSSIVFCGHCGDIYRRIKWNNRGCKSTVWRCVSRVLKKSSGIDCPARTIHEEDLQNAVVTAVNDAWARRDMVIPALQENIRSVLCEDTGNLLEEVDLEIKEKQEELLSAGKDQAKIDEIGDAIIELREKRQEILTSAARNVERQERIDTLTSFLEEQSTAVTEYSEVLVRRLIEKIVVYDEKLVVEFKSGLSVDVDA